MALPKNRSKHPATRGKPLKEVIAIPGLEKISPKTVNEYLGALSGFMRWAVDNGHAEQQLFDNMKVRLQKSASTARDAFTADQLKTLHRHCTDPVWSSSIKPAHKWVTLIAMFTGMRLNEVCQLETTDIKQIDGLWCIDVTEQSGTAKRLKTSAAQRRIPVHDALLEAGLIEFQQRQAKGSNTRLFPELSYCRNNGYGRTISRWFNDKLLPQLSMKTEQLVFHSLRHTMVTRLAQADVPDTQIKAIVGHEQQGVTFSTYFKDGYRPAQLKAALDRFRI